MNHSDAFLGTFTESLLAYGLGRVIDYRDMPVVRSIQQEAAQKDNRFSAFVLGIVHSAPFQMSRTEQGGTVDTGVAAVDKEAGSAAPKAVGRVH